MGHRAGRASADWVWLGSRRRVRRPKRDESVSASTGGEWATDDGWGGDAAAQTAAAMEAINRLDAASSTPAGEPLPTDSIVR